MHVFWCLDALCVNICVRDPLMSVTAPGADFLCENPHQTKLSSAVVVFLDAYPRVL